MLKQTQYDKLHDQVAELYLRNRREKSGHMYTVPSPDTYPYQWLWDSCFHAIVLSHIDPEMAKAELNSVTQYQFENGMVPHMTYWRILDKSTFPRIMWGKRRTSSITQPPMLAEAAWSVYKSSGDKEFLRGMLPKIEAFHNYLRRHRDPRKSGLIGVVNPDESGEDNSPRYDRVLKLRANHDPQRNFQRRMKLVYAYRANRFVVKKRMDLQHWVRDVPMNAIFVRNLITTATIAEELGDKERAVKYRRQAKKTGLGMREWMLEGNFFWPTIGYDQKKVRIKTWAMFMPLYAKVATVREAEALRQLFHDHDTFATPYRLPTVAMDEASFNPNGDWRGTAWEGVNWRGPVWIASNWFVIQGLQNYGFNAEAKRLATDSLRLVKKSGFREYYDPLTGKGHGARDFTWGGLVLDMYSRGLLK